VSGGGGSGAAGGCGFSSRCGGLDSGRFQFKQFLRPFSAGRRVALAVARRCCFFTWPAAAEDGDATERVRIRYVQGQPTRVRGSCVLRRRPPTNNAGRQPTIERVGAHSSKYGPKHSPLFRGPVSFRPIVVLCFDFFSFCKNIQLFQNLEKLDLFEIHHFFWKIEKIYKNKKFWCFIITWALP
jgi:hypothetical protein